MAYWKWEVSCYYAEDVKPPFTPGGLAIRTQHRDDHSKDMEVVAGERRKDIGRIEVVLIQN